MSESNIGVVAPKDRILVKEIEVERKSTGGIILTEKAGDPNNTARKGEIVSSGIKCFSVGQVIYYVKHAGHRIQHNSELYTSLVQMDVVGEVTSE